jgi:hypothetical protein
LRDTNKKLLTAERKDFRGLDAIEAVLFLCGKYTMLPEIFEIFGPEKAWKFLTVFGGRTIKVPSEKSVQESISHLLIWSELSNTHDSQREAIKRLAHRYDMKDSEVRSAAARVQDMIDAQERFQKQLAEFDSGSNGSNQEASAGTESRRRRPKASEEDVEGHTDETGKIHEQGGAIG